MTDLKYTIVAINRLEYLEDLAKGLRVTNYDGAETASVRALIPSNLDDQRDIMLKNVKAYALEVDVDTLRAFYLQLSGGAVRELLHLIWLKRVGR